MTKFEEYKWNVGTSTYTLSAEINFSYDTNNKFQTIISRDYTVPNGAADGKGDVTFNTDGSPKLMLYYKASGSGWAVNPYVRYIYVDTFSTVPAPNPTITLGPNPMTCSGIGSALSYVATSNNPTTYSITWSPADTLLGMKNVLNQPLLSSPIYLPFRMHVNSGVFNGSIRVSNGSGSNTYAFQLTVLAKPSLNLQTLAPITQGDTVHFLKYTNLIGSANVYSLSYTGNAFAQGFTDVIWANLSPDSLKLKIPAMAAEGTYNAMFNVKDTFGCTSEMDTLQLIIQKATGIPNTQTNMEFSVYPNPARDETYLQSREQILYTELYDIHGKLHLRTESQSINLSNLPAGVYILNAYGINGMACRKLIKY